MNTQARKPAGSALSTGGQFAPRRAAEADVPLGSPQPAWTATERKELEQRAGEFADGYDEHDIDALGGALESMEFCAAWDERSDGWCRGSSNLYGRIDDGEWRELTQEAWDYLTGEQDEFPDAWLDDDPDPDMCAFEESAEYRGLYNIAWRDND